MKPNACPCSCDLPFLESVDSQVLPTLAGFWSGRKMQRLLVLLFKLSPAYAMTD